MACVFLDQLVITDQMIKYDQVTVFSYFSHENVSSKDI